MTMENRALLKKLLEAIRKHPDFQSNQEFNTALKYGTYSRAVQIVEGVVQNIEDDTWIVIPSNMPHISDSISEQDISDNNIVFHIPDTSGE